MADNYLMFSEVLTQLTPEEEAWLRSQMEWIMVRSGQVTPIVGPHDENLDTEAEWYGPRFLQGCGECDPESDTLGFQYDFLDDDEVPDGPGRHLWLYAEEHGDPAHAAVLVQRYLKQFHPDQCWSLTFATTCSKPRSGEFSGGAVFVTAEETKWGIAEDFLDRERRAFENSGHPDHDTDRLVRLAQKLGLRSASLDELVHETAATAAAAVNNGGVVKQIAYLAEQLGADETERMLAGLAGPVSNNDKEEP